MSSTTGVRRRRRVLVAAVLGVLAVCSILITQAVRQSGVTGSPAAPVSSATPSAGPTSTSPKSSAEPSDRASDKADPKASTKPSKGDSSKPAKKPSKPEKSNKPSKPSKPEESAKPTRGRPPTPGTGKTVPVQAVKTKKAVDLDSPAAIEGKLKVRVTDVERVRGRATAPGEIAGPALRIDVEVDNGTDQAVDLTGALVALSYGDGTPATQLVADTEPLPTSVPAGEVRTGRFVYTVPAEEKKVRVEVSYTGQAPTVAFEGRIRN